MGLGTALAVGGSIAGGLLGARGAKDAAKEAARAQDAATQLQREQYYNALRLNEPYRVGGTGAWNMLSRLYGLPYMDYQPLSSLSGQAPYGAQQGGQPSGVPRGSYIYNWDAETSEPQYRQLTGQTAGSIAAAIDGGADPMQIHQGAPDMSVFFASPDYEFRRREGQRGIEQGAAARGGALSGNALRALTGFNSDLASTEYGNFYERLMRMAGMGGAATNNAIGVGQNYANQAGALGVGAGEARASGILGRSNAWGNALNSGMQALGNWYDNRNVAPAAAPSGYNYGAQPSIFGNTDWWGPQPIS